MYLNPVSIGPAAAHVKHRLDQAIADGEVPHTVDIHAPSRFVQAVHGGMSIMARDGASCGELEAQAEVAMASWDVQVGPADRQAPTQA